MADDPQVQAALITAIFDLAVVKGIRGAIRVNLLKKGGREGLLGNIENPKPPSSQANFGEQHHAGAERPSYIIDIPVARLRAVEPSPRCECRSTPRATDYAPALPNLVPTDVTLPTSDAERASGVASRHESPLAPPWRMPLPIAVPHAIHVVKYQAVRSDQIHKGQMLDFVM